MAAGVTELVPRATEILLDQDLEGAEYMILGDDEYDVAVDRNRGACLSVIALQAPVAGDLRRSCRRSRSSPTSSARPTCASTSARRRGASTATSSTRTSAA